MNDGTPLDALVIGGGSAGLAAAFWLQRRNLRFTVLEANSSPSGAWPVYYSSLTLFTPARHSRLPGLPFPGPPDHYPSRDAMAAYLRAYAEQLALPVEQDADVTCVQSMNGGFHITSRDGRTWSARTVVAATGTFRRPHRPSLPGAEHSRVQTLHASDYRHPEPFAGQRIVVVGAGNSGAQIAAELGRVARVTLAFRHPLRLFPQRPLGHDLTDWLTWSGVERVPIGAFGRVPDAQPVIAVPGLRAALHRGNPDLRPMFTALTQGGVRWADGSVEPIDTVILATGYGWNGAYLPPPALGPDGEPRQCLGSSTAIPGLYFVGLPGQRTVASGTVRAAGPDARAVVRHLAHHLEASHAPT
ncbi:putative flavoprotein involved in K+ transport [Deinococcus metalli]|uniref:Monooxygenase n=1 Tax=Deinococcus metalli TaxID=1141878 RepID=A0A7W8NQM3_9DEIO|nr:NAD(P)/FAD-dependent oxidoreductase [Deinococcus metalli]MBB5379219.1 putative flavoprotein involved in K+ transport [Deinococcus metalli]GHF65513.1 monooxygenase [Deinococcus metalli]